MPLCKKCLGDEPENCDRCGSLISRSRREEHNPEVAGNIGVLFVSAILFGVTVFLIWCVGF